MVLDGWPEPRYPGPNPPLRRAGVVTPLRAKEIRVRVAGQLRDDVDIRLLAELLIDSWMETAVQRDQEHDHSGAAGLTEIKDREADES